ncbi:MAG: NAD-glutamate dehydrogenase domain-containing protein, partial [Devosia sp.]
MDASLNTRDALTAKAEALKDSEPNFRRLLLAVIAATDNDDLGIYSAEVLESMLRGTYGRLGKRGLELHQVHSILPEYTGLPEILEIFSADMPFIVDSVLGAIRAKGGVVKFLSHPVLNLDPESHRLLDQPGDSSVTESVLIVHIEPLADQTARAGLIAEIEGTLIEVRRATMDWKAMLDRLKKVHDEWRANPPRGPLATKDEALAFLDWLGDHNFTFLGMREYRVEGEGTERKLLPLVSSGLGLLENRDFHFLRSGKDYVEMTEQHVAFLADSDNLMVTKANVKSRVHRRAYMDYIGIKLYREGGEVSGELRLIGLFTSQALATPHTDVPLVRRRVSEVMRRSGYNPGGHAGKALMAALDTYPRDELFQISGDLLFQFANLIGSLSDRPRVRVLPRIDRFDNFVSVLVYVPRDRYSSESRARIGEHLAQVYQGRVSAYYPHFPEGGDLVRVHFIIGRDGGRTPRIDRDDLEESVTALVRSFADRILALGPRSKVTSWSTAFNAAYQSRNTAEQAVADASVMDSLQDEHALALKLTARGGADGAFALKVYHRRRPIPLSDRVPMLENFGFRVIDERTFTIAPEGRDTFYIHEMVLEPTGKADGIAERAPLIEQAILAVWQNDAESDGLNQLTSTTGLLWHDVAILRALARYLRQIGVSYSRAYLAQVLNLHADVASALVTLFHALLHPGFQGNRDTAIAKARADIAAALDATGSLDEDRIIRRFLNLVDAAMRTNNYQLDAAGMRRPALAIKFDCHKVDGLPEPRPLREIFVYSPRVEGLHLRFGAIARGG